MATKFALTIADLACAHTQFIMKNSKYRRADGYIVGDGYSRIEPITNDVLAVRERTDLNQWFSSLAHNGVQKISTEALRAMKDAYVKAIEG